MISNNDVIKNINSIEGLINQISCEIEKNSINFDNIINLVDYLSSLNNNITTLNCDCISIEEYNEKLTAALSAFEEKDYILFNEVLQYELKPLLEFWKDNIN